MSVVRAELFSSGSLNNFAGSFYCFFGGILAAVACFSYGLDNFFYNCFSCFSCVGCFCFSLFSVVSAGEHRHAESNGEHKN